MDTAATLAAAILALLLAIAGIALYAIGSAPRLGGDGDPRARRPLAAQKKGD
jgi:hypothetical protein